MGQNRDKNENRFSRRRPSSAHSVAGLGSTAYAMRQAARSRPPPSCAHRPVSLVRRARPTATTSNCRRCSFTRSGVILHLLMQRQWPCKFLVLAALSGMWGVPRTHWLHNSHPLRRRCNIAFDASCRRWKWAHASRYDMMVTVSTGRIRLVVESYGSLGGGGTLFRRVLGYFLS